MESWRNDVLSKLQTRNRGESEPFAELIAVHTKAFEQTSHLQQQNSQLIYQNEKLKQDLLNASRGPRSSTSSQEGGGDLQQHSGLMAFSNEEVMQLNRKIVALQEELTELHKSKGQNAQQVIDLTAKIKLRERDLSEKTAEWLKCQDDLHSMHLELDRTKLAMEELCQTNQLLKDEYTTLQLALSSAERKLIEVQKENDRLVAQVIELKEKDVAKMNMENDLFLQKKQEHVRKQLEEAAKETKVVVTKSQSQNSHPGAQANLDSLICYNVRLPNRAYLSFEAHESDVNAIKWSPHGLVVATGGADRKIKLWDLSKGTYADLRGILSGSNGAVMSLDFDASGTFLLASSSDFASRVWSLDDKRLRHTLTGHSGKIYSAKFLGGENTKVATGSHDRTIKVWDLRSRACINTLFPASSCNDLVSLDQLVIGGHFDQKLRIYDTRVSGQATNELTLNGKITSVDLAKNGQSVLACCRDNSLVIVDLRTMSPCTNPFRADGFKVGCDFTRAAFSPDSEYVSVGSSDGTVYIWNVNKPEKWERMLKEHKDSVIAVAWQPAGNSVTTCDRNKRVVVWADI